MKGHHDSGVFGFEIDRMKEEKANGNLDHRQIEGHREGRHHPAQGGNQQQGSTHVRRHRPLRGLLGFDEGANRLAEAPLSGGHSTQQHGQQERMQGVVELWLLLNERGGASGTRVRL